MNTLKPIVSGLLFALIFLGCYTVYQRETAMLKNQELLYSEITSVKSARVSDISQIQQFVNITENKISTLEITVSELGKKKR